ncbi:MAG TPA: SDR family NAD(P)-dependent oxidoreductase, partial [Bacteroidetes bacterium]|nr:SDR family NAD(P)-dependent oxidoreductase [Bacteroidota bacterium]
MRKLTRILITGAAGYIGSELCRHLLAIGYEVIGLDNLKFGGNSLVELMPMSAFSFVKGDVRDAELVANILKDVDGVIHLAAIV